MLTFVDSEGRPVDLNDPSAPPIADILVNGIPTTELNSIVNELRARRVVTLPMETDTQCPVVLSDEYSSAIVDADVIEALCHDIRSGVMLDAEAIRSTVHAEADRLRGMLADMLTDPLAHPPAIAVHAYLTRPIRREDIDWLKLHIVPYCALYRRVRDYTRDTSHRSTHNPLHLLPSFDDIITAADRLLNYDAMRAERETLASALQSLRDAVTGAMQPIADALAYYVDTPDAVPAHDYPLTLQPATLAVDTARIARAIQSSLSSSRLSAVGAMPP